MSQLNTTLSILSGTCPICHATFKLVPSSGLLRQHGHGHGRPACAGSGQLPLGSIVDLQLATLQGHMAGLAPEFGGCLSPDQSEGEAE